MPIPLSRASSALVVASLLSCASAPVSSPGREALRDASRLETVLVKGGCFQMGADEEDCDAGPEERPRHEVCVADFRVGKYEVTHGQWRSVMGSDTTAASTCRQDDCPVDNVSWDEVQEFITRLNAKVGGRYRLPTEAEWEYAARSGGKPELFAGGRAVDDLAWYAENSGKINHPVGSKLPNGLGLHDLSGNVWEMTSDWYDPEYYARSPRADPRGPSSGADHVVRGGCRTGGRQNQRTTRRTYIGDRTKGAGRGGNVGFRLVAPP